MWTMLRRIRQVRRQIIFVAKLPAPNSRRLCIARHQLARVLTHECDGAAVGVTPAIAQLADEVRHRAHVPKKRGNQSYTVPRGALHDTIESREVF